MGVGEEKGIVGRRDMIPRREIDTTRSQRHFDYGCIRCTCLFLWLDVCMWRR